MRGAAGREARESYVEVKEAWSLRSSQVALLEPGHEGAARLEGKDDMSPVGETGAVLVVRTERWCGGGREGQVHSLI